MGRRKLFQRYLKVERVNPELQELRRKEKNRHRSSNSNRNSNRSSHSESRSAPASSVNLSARRNSPSHKDLYNSSDDQDSMSITIDPTESLRIGSQTPPCQDSGATPSEDEDPEGTDTTSSTPTDQDKNDDTAQGQEPLHKSVSFANLQVRKFNVDIGDHPCCTEGLPVCLGWDYEEDESVPLEDYEHDRVRRPRCDLRQSAEDRRQMLLCSYGENELRRAERKLHRTRSCHVRVAERRQAHFFTDIDCTNCQARDTRLVEPDEGEEHIQL